MVSERIRPSTLGAVVVATVLLAGCSAAIGPLGDTAEQQVAQQVQQRVESVDGFTATRTTTTTFDNETHSTTAEVWVRPHTGEMRAEPVRPDARAGDVTVIGENTSWFYDESEHTARRMNISGVTGETDLGAQLGTLFERRDVVFEGEVTLDGESVQKLSLHPENDTQGFSAGTITMWVDLDEQFPVQIRYASGGEANVTSTIRYENVTVNPGIPDARFRFDPPANATVTTSSLSMQTYDSRAALANDTEMAVPDPTVPDEFSFDRGVVLDDAVTLQYTNGSASLLVTVSDAESESSDRGESVAIGDHEGRFVSTGEFASVRWACDGNSVSVSGQLGRTAILDVARSIGCS
jgi:outer membrane lipoprotein-sorting protein